MLFGMSIRPLFVGREMFVEIVCGWEIDELAVSRLE